MDAGSGSLHDSLRSAPLQEPFTASAATGAWSKTTRAMAKRGRRVGWELVKSGGIWRHRRDVSESGRRDQDALSISSSHTSATHANWRRLRSTARLQPFSAKALQLFSQ